MTCRKVSRPSYYTLSKYLLGECSEKESMEIDFWLASSHEAQEAWDTFTQSFAQAKQQISSTRLPSEKEQSIWGVCIPQRHQRSFLALAAALILVVLSASSIWYCRSVKNRTTLSVAGSAVEYATLKDTLQALTWITRHFSDTSSHALRGNDLTGGLEIALCERYSDHRKNGAELTATTRQ